MLSILIALLVSPGAGLPQQRTLTPADVQAVEALVVEEMVPAEGNLGARPTNGRMLLVDQDQAWVVMQKMVFGVLPAGLTIPRAFRAANHNAAIQCARPHHDDCQVANDGIYLTISDAELMPATGELRVHAGVVWTYAAPDVHRLNGYDLDLFFAHTGSGWHLVRKGPARTG